MELSDVESFDFFFNAIWRKQVKKVENPSDTDSTMKMIGDRVVGNIVDTILFQQGKPHKWLFTSVKTGVSLFGTLSCVCGVHTITYRTIT